ncbi:MAG TPA: hypothetical protein VK796_12500 [Cytophaga sp.]|jgi:4-amino-4-deoxy-L-arabinose transferase-like glycosyltransferase|nr:hypothetical protein [Cytophaga sp.]
MPALKSREDKIFAFALLILFIVFNHNLGLMPLLADEPTRALVSLEMLLRNNYIFPTLGNEAYLNKPPLFNWILAGVMYLIKDYREWHLRIISIIPFFMIAITHYIVVSKEVNKKVALWSSLAFLTCGRILFYDSMMAYIDPLFSLFIVLNVYWIFIQSRKPLSLRFFILSYILCLLAFFLKGLPALSFQACTLLTICIYRKKAASLISLNHLAGIATFLIFTSIYYYEYAAYADTSMLFTKIVSQSSQRTPIATSIADTLMHLIQFPAQFILDFCPFSLFILFAFRKNALSTLKENEFIFLSVLFFVSNIWLYWISAETRARYLFMFLPMFFTVAFYMYEKYKSLLSKKIIRLLVLILSATLIVTLIVLSCLQRFSFIDHKELLIAGLILIIVVFILFNYRYAIQNVLSIAIILTLLRITFNFYILPLREKESPESTNKIVGQQLGSYVNKERLTIINRAPVNHDILYYMTKERAALVEQDCIKDTPQKYLKNKKQVLTISADSLLAYSIKENFKDTLLVSDSIFNRVQKRVLDEWATRRNNLPDGYYICTQTDLIRYKLKPIHFFNVTYESQTLALAKK